jgi:hypothetical protein
MNSTSVTLKERCVDWNVNAARQRQIKSASMKQTLLVEGYTGRAVPAEV